MTQTEKLIQAARRGDINAVKKLIPAPCAGVKRPCALQWAVESGHKEVVELLLPFYKPKANASIALRCAAELGFTEIVEMLIPVSDPLADYSCALRHAAECGHRDIVEMLIPVSDCQMAGTYALSSSADNGHKDVVELLIRSLNFKSIEFSAALVFALESGHSGIAELLLPYSDRVIVYERLTAKGDNVLRELDAVLARRELASMTADVGCQDKEMSPPAPFTVRRL